MPILRSELIIYAPREVCFDLTRSINIHEKSTAQTKERAVGGVTQGLIKLNQTVTWEAVHFGLKQKLTVKISEMAYPYYFVDEMVSGAFKRFRHVHEFVIVDGGTLMIDIFDYTSPLGVLGRLADLLFLKAYMSRFLEKRNLYIKQVAEEADLFSRNHFQAKRSDTAEISPK
jgi:ligand-binding SRPBCC domain-containing protein